MPSAIADSFCLIADEAHYMQNLSSKRTQRALVLAKCSGFVHVRTGGRIAGTSV
jgi:hypothetical protein